MISSIKAGLVGWFIAVSSAVLIVLGFLLYFQLSEIVIGSVDSHLDSEMQFIAGLVRIEAEQGPLETELLEFSQAAVGEYSVSLSGHYYQIIAPDGKLLVRSPSLSLTNEFLPLEAKSPVPSYRTILGPQRVPLRILSQSFQLPSGTITIQSADSLETSYQLLGSFRKILLIVFPALMIVSGIGVWLLADRSLRPLMIFSNQIGQITERNLNQRVEERRTRKELKPLAIGFNTMLGRLGDAFSKQGQFLSDASHELRTPTSVIKSTCDVILHKDRTLAEYQEALRSISTNVDRMAEIINRILEISRLDARTFSLVTIEINLLSLLADVVKLLEPSASHRQIAILISGAPQPVRADRERLTEAFLNIVDNAIKYNHPGGRVDIEVTRSDREVLIAVTDTGIGISVSDREKIFDRFHRLESGRHLAAGSGLGLSIARTIVEAHAGRIEVRSEPGKGSQFLVHLPPARTTS